MSCFEVSPGSGRPSYPCPSPVTEAGIVLPARKVGMITDTRGQYGIFIPLPWHRVAGAHISTWLIRRVRSVETRRV